MKKIISLLSVFAMIATLFTTVAFADDNNKFYVEETVDGTNVTLDLYMTTEYYLSSASNTLNLADAYLACDNITFTKGPDSNTFNVNSSQKVLAWAITSAGEATGTLYLGQITFVNVKSDFTLPSKRAAVAKDADKVSIIANFTDEQTGYTVKAPVTEPELPAARTAITGAFEAVVGDYVEISLTNKGSKIYALPTGVKGTGKVAGMLKYTVNADDANAPAAGDVFTGLVKNIYDADKSNEILKVVVE